MLPIARTDRITVRELAEETLVYDLERNKAHCLNRTSALVWRHCDGRTGVAEMAQILHRELGVPAEESVVELALEQLQRRDLLQGPLTPASEDGRMSRRVALRKFVKLGALAASIPLIMSLTAKPASASNSNPVNLCAGVICTGACTNGTGNCKPANNSPVTGAGCCQCSGNFCGPITINI